MTLRWLGTDEFTVRPYDIDSFPSFTVDSPAYQRDRLLSVAIVDTETLGLADDDPVIEIAIRLVAYDPATSELLGRFEDYSSLHDPRVPIPAEITKLTGITDDDVRGHVIDVKRVRFFLTCVDLVVAHNAAFDRPRVEALTGPTLTPWACSKTMIDWQGHGLPSSSLGALALAHGFYWRAHRAMGDVGGLLHLLDTRNAETRRTYFAELLDEARRPVHEVWANGLLFNRSDALRARGYSWRKREGMWATIVPDGLLEAELAWLREYGVCREPVAKRVDPRRRFAKES
jgi:DNA polymerase III subunit epsilon